MPWLDHLSVEAAVHLIAIIQLLAIVTAANMYPHLLWPVLIASLLRGVTSIAILGYLSRRRELVRRMNVRVRANNNITTVRAQQEPEKASYPEEFLQHGTLPPPYIQSTMPPSSNAS
jgi:hypothetical protein